jgi:hypothetical protein
MIRLMFNLVNSIQRGTANHQDKNLTGALNIVGICDMRPPLNCAANIFQGLREARAGLEGNESRNADISKCEI